MIKLRAFFLPLLFCLHIANICAQGTAGTKKTMGTVERIDQLNARARYIYLANPARARALAEEALLLSKKNNYRLGMGQSFLVMGSAYWAQSYYPISLFYNNTALKYFTDKDTEWLSSAYRGIGRDYVDLKDFKKGLFFINKAYAVAGNDNDWREKAVSERSFAYLRLKDYKNAFADINESVKLSRQLDDSSEVAILYGRLSLVYFGQQKLDLSAAYADSTFRMSYLTDNKRLRSTVWVTRSSIAYIRKNYDDGVKYAAEAIKLADSIGVMEIAANAHKWLIRCYEAKGDKDKVIYFQKQYTQVQDSLNNADKQKSIQLIQSYFALDSKLHDIEEMQQKSKIDGLYIKSQRSTIYALTFVMILLGLSVCLLFIYSKQKADLSKKVQEQNKELIDKNTLIEGQAAELKDINALKDRLLTIIGHDLKVPLVNLRNIVDLFDMGELSPSEVKTIMRDIDPVIKSAELTLSNLIQWAGRLLKGQDINITNIDLYTIINNKAAIFKSVLKQKGIDYSVQINPGQKVFADEDHVKMIIRNLVNNAIKFTSSGGHVGIVVKQHGDRVIIEVSDTGKGMTQTQIDKLFSADRHFSTEGTQGEKGTGIGLVLCKQLIELNNGTIGVTSALGAGSTFSVNLPAIKTT